jgi:hypothetical protein
MFARVNYNRNIRETLGYNERKLKLGRGECILAENFMKDADQLTRKDKLYRFERLNVLNEKAKANTLHISLSFHPSDRLSNDQMRELAKKYMERLHLDHQPWLAYRHHDTGHPHLHIVSSLIQHDGSRLKLDNILRYQSRRLVQEMEKEFSLTRFYRPDSRQAQKLSLEAPRKVIYGEPGRKDATERVLDHVINQYKYTTLAELNAVLWLYNVRAKIVWEDPSLNKARGLMYHTLDEKGHVTGLSFKSSSFPSQPTLRKLEQKFVQNQLLQRLELKKLTLSVDYALVGKSVEWEAFRENLLKEKIHTLLEKDKTGDWRNIYFVDSSTRCSFDGMVIGGRYTSQAIRARCASEEQLRQEQSLKLIHQHKLKNHFL